MKRARLHITAECPDCHGPLPIRPGQSPFESTVFYCDVCKQHVEYVSLEDRLAEIEAKLP